MQPGRLPFDQNRIRVSGGISDTGPEAILPLEVNTNGGLDVNIVGGSSAGTQYSSGITTPSPVVGNAIIFDNSGTLQDVSVANPLPVSATFSGSISSSPTYSQNPAAGSPTPAYGLIDSSYRPQVSIATALPAGANAIGSITNTSFTANAGTNLNTSALVTSANLTAGTQKSQIVDGSGNVIASTSNALDVYISGGGTSGTQYQELAVTQPATGTLALGRYQTSLPTLTNLQMNEPMLDASSRLLVNLVASSATVTVAGTVTTTPPSNASTNLAQVGGSAISLGTSTAANSLPVALPTATITTLTPPAAITNFALETGGNLATLAGTVSGGLVKVSDAGGSFTVDTGTPGTFAVTNAGTFAVQDSTTETNTGTTATNTGTIAGAVTSSVMQSNIKNFGGTAVTIGQQLAAASMPVILPSATITTLSQPTLQSGSTTTVTQGTGSNLHVVTDSGTITTVSAVTAITNALPAGTNAIGNVGASTAIASAVPSNAFYNGISDQTGKLTGMVSANTASGTTGNGLLGVANMVFDGTDYRLQTVNSTTYTSKYGGDVNLLGTLGTAFTTAGLVDVKGTDGNVFVRQTTAANLNATVINAAGSALMGKVGIDQTSIGSTNAISIADIAATAVNVAAAGTLLVGNADGAGNKWTSNSTATSGKYAQDLNMLSILGTAPTTAGVLNVQGVSGGTTIPVTATPAVAGTIYNGQKAVTASAATIATTQAITQGVTVEALSTNTISVFVGASGVTTSTGIELPAGSSITLPVSNVNLVYVIASTTGATVTYVAV